MLRLQCRQSLKKVISRDIGGSFTSTGAPCNLPKLRLAFPGQLLNCHSLLLKSNAKSGRRFSLTYALIFGLSFLRRIIIAHFKSSLPGRNGMAPPDHPVVIGKRRLHIVGAQRSPGFTGFSLNSFHEDRSTTTALGERP